MTDRWIHRLRHRSWKGVKDKGCLGQHTVTQDDVCELKWKQICNMSIVVRVLLFFGVRFPQRHFGPFFPIVARRTRGVQLHLAPPCAADPRREHSCGGQRTEHLGRWYGNAANDVRSIKEPIQRNPYTQKKPATYCKIPVFRPSCSRSLFGSTSLSRCTCIRS
jgi:hypothetical protein